MNKAPTELNPIMLLYEDEGLSCSDRRSLGRVQSDYQVLLGSYIKVEKRLVLCLKNCRTFRRMLMCDTRNRATSIVRIFDDSFVYRTTSIHT